MISSEVLTRIIRRNKPDAIAVIKGNRQYPQLEGSIRFFRTPYEGVLVCAEVSGLPDRRSRMRSDFFAMHIHEQGDCSHAFENVGMHYNPESMPHPYHAGDLPPLLSNDGYAWTAFYDERFTIGEIIGKSVIIHSQSDDFRSQPSGDAGEKIACGEIESGMLN